MTAQACTVFTKECKSNNGVLIIENVFNQDRPKTDIIREIIRNTADYGSQAKEVTS